MLQVDHDDRTHSELLYNTPSACRSTPHGHPIRITTEEMNVPANPLQGEKLIVKACISDAILLYRLTAHKPEATEAVVQRHKYQGLPSHRSSLGHTSEFKIILRASNIAASVDVD